MLQHNTSQRIEEVVEHPLLDLLNQPNDFLNMFDLWELTQLYLECVGLAYWLLEFNDFTDTPRAIWLLPAHQVRPMRSPGSPNIIDGYEFTGQGQVQRFSVREVIVFRIPDPRNPYHGGYSPLRACYESVILSTEYTAMRRSIYENVGVPSAIIAPETMLNNDERDRLEEQWNQKFRRGGAGRVLVAESNLRVSILSHSLGDLAALAEAQATKTDILNAFHIPPPFFNERTNLANMQAAKELHHSLAIGPRLKRRDEKLNQSLVPLFDTTGRLFLASETPGEDSRLLALQQQDADVRTGIRSINEIRAERGLPPVPWGDSPQEMAVVKEKGPSTKDATAPAETTNDRSKS